MATFDTRGSPAPRHQSWLGIAATIALLAGVLPAQHPMVTRSQLPTPGCGPLADLVVADFDSSGQPDFVQIVSTPSLVLALTHDPVTSPGGGICQSTPVPGTWVSGAYSTCALANLNGDAFPDVLVYVGNGEAVLDAFGDGSGGFSIPGTGPYPTPTPNGFLMTRVIHDFNHDGRDDVATVNAGVLQVMLNLPSGWTLAWSQNTSNNQWLPAAADFDGDGNVDLVWTEPAPPGYQLRDLRIAYGSGSGTFTLSPTALVASSDFHDCEDVADLDGDGRDDLIIRKQDVGLTPYHLPIVWGTPPQQAPLVTFIPTTNEILFRAKSVEFDRDGARDLVLEAYPIWPTATRDVVLYRGLGGRQFSAPIVLSTEPYLLLATEPLYLVDVDGDLDVDILRPSFGALVTYQLLLFRNETNRAPGCPGSAGLVPSCSVGVATPGNAAFAIGLSSALPNSYAGLGVSLAPVATTGCGLAIDVSPSQLVLPMGPIGIMPTSPGGSASIALPLPPSPTALSGMAFYVQWAVLDPQGSFGALGLTFALSEARTIYVW